MGRLVKKIANGLLIFSLVFNTYGIIFNVKAEDDNLIECVNTNTVNLVDNKGEDSILLDKLEYDAKNNVTDLSDDIEEELNEVGVFDSEIEQLDDYTIEKIEGSVNTQVSVIYYKDNEKTGKKDEMSQAEVDRIIEENIQEGVCEYEEKTDLISEIFTKIGFKSVQVHAAQVSDSDTDYSPSKAVKSVLICTQEKKGGKINVSYTASWLKEAYYRGKDVLGVTMKRADYDKNSLKCYHTANHSWTQTVYIDKHAFRSNHSEQLSTNPTAKHTGISGFTFTVNLFGERNKMNGLGISNEKYSNEYINIRFTCSASSKKNVVFSSDYNHWKSNISVSPSISVSEEGVSVGVSGSKTNYYQKLDGNAYVNFNHI